MPLSTPLFHYDCLQTTKWHTRAKGTEICEDKLIETAARQVICSHSLRNDKDRNVSSSFSQSIAAASTEPLMQSKDKFMDKFLSSCI
jgi:hypothetical protein